ncbi:MAG: hypothetical protein QXY40_07355 [Candidatus Methanomethylicia archaeon]
MASELEFSGKCPRCSSVCVSYGSVLLGIGKTRKLATTLYVCGKCELVFYEKSKP